MRSGDGENTVDDRAAQQAKRAQLNMFRLVKDDLVKNRFAPAADAPMERMFFSLEMADHDVVVRSRQQ